jgi:Family of unknown function (DUF6527)
VKLTDLEPDFVRYDGEKITICGETFASAQGIWFLCPACFATNNGPIGTHTVAVTFEGRGATPGQGSHGKDGKPTRWKASGTDFEDLTLTPSIKLEGGEGGCAWHGHVTKGAITP